MSFPLFHPLDIEGGDEVRETPAGTFRYVVLDDPTVEFDVAVFEKASNRSWNRVGRYVAPEKRTKRGRKIDTRTILSNRDRSVDPGMIGMGIV